MKYKKISKIFLSIGAVSAVTTTTALTVVSCGNSKGKNPNNPKKETWADFKKDASKETVANIVAQTIATTNWAKGNTVNFSGTGITSDDSSKTLSATIINSTKKEMATFIISFADANGKDQTSYNVNEWVATKPVAYYDWDGFKKAALAETITNIADANVGANGWSTSDQIVALGGKTINGVVAHDDNKTLTTTLIDQTKKQKSTFTITFKVNDGNGTPYSSGAWTATKPVDYQDWNDFLTSANNADNDWKAIKSVYNDNYKFLKNVNFDLKGVDQKGRSTSNNLHLKDEGAAFTQDDEKHTITLTAILTPDNTYGFLTDTTLTFTQTWTGESFDVANWNSHYDLKDFQKSASDSVTKDGFKTFIKNNVDGWKNKNPNPILTVQLPVDTDNGIKVTILDKKLQSSTGAIDMNTTKDNELNKIYGAKVDNTVHNTGWKFSKVSYSYDSWKSYITKITNDVEGKYTDSKVVNLRGLVKRYSSFATSSAFDRYPTNHLPKGKQNWSQSDYPFPGEENSKSKYTWKWIITESKGINRINFKLSKDLEFSEQEKSVTITITNTGKGAGDETDNAKAKIATLSFKMFFNPNKAPDPFTLIMYPISAV